MMRLIKILLLCFSIIYGNFACAQRTVVSFNKGWKFLLGDDSAARRTDYDDRLWRTVRLPHDWSIEGSFSETYPTSFNEAALPAGIGWYRKTFSLPAGSENKKLFIDFDGVYRNSEVWINGHYLGRRPNGYISFRYGLTPYLHYGKAKNVIAVRVDNSAQPNSRWYTGSGIYRNVWLEATGPVAVDQWGSFISLSRLAKDKALMTIRTWVSAADVDTWDDMVYEIYDQGGNLIAHDHKPGAYRTKNGQIAVGTGMNIPNPKLWSTDRPYLYEAAIKLFKRGKQLDVYTMKFGIRQFDFDAKKGFYLNGKPLKILGVCLHHDLGALGAAVNTRAIERQLQILKAMGCNAIRTAHNPPAPELLDLCDKMGFIVMDEAFDMWKKKKNKYDYSADFNEWHRPDLEDQIKRDRNHPSVFIWSIGNEIREQFDSSGTPLARELVQIVKELDPTRPVTSALTENDPAKNFIYQSHALDLLGFNYKLGDYSLLPQRFPGERLIASETASALASRGHYDMPSDSVRIWPPDSRPFRGGNPDYSVSAYDHVFAYWGATHEKSWMAVKKRDYISGTFVWSGFDFLGEPVPYQWPARSSYYGIVDLAGFPKDVYYMYQSEWTKRPVLHVFPHWNWKTGDSVDVWAYYNIADQVELFLNGRSLGVRRKRGDSLHVMWRVPYAPGTLKAVSTKNGKLILAREIRTAGKPAKIRLIPDRKMLRADGNDLSFVTVEVLDARGNPVPDADNLIQFSVKGPGFIEGVDNGNPASMEPFKASRRQVFHGKCLVIVRTEERDGRIELSATAPLLAGDKLILQSNH